MFRLRYSFEAPKDPSICATPLRSGSIRIPPKFVSFTIGEGYREKLFFGVEIAKKGVWTKRREKKMGLANTRFEPRSILSGVHRSANRAKKDLKTCFSDINLLVLQIYIYCSLPKLAWF